LSTSEIADGELRDYVTPGEGFRHAAGAAGIQIDADIVGSGARQGFTGCASDLKTPLDPQLAVRAHNPRGNGYLVAEDGRLLVINFRAMGGHASADPDAFLQGNAQGR